MNVINRFMFRWLDNYPPLCKVFFINGALWAFQAGLFYNYIGILLPRNLGTDTLVVVGAFFVMVDMFQKKLIPYWSVKKLFIIDSIIYPIYFILGWGYILTMDAKWLGALMCLSLLDMLNGTLGNKHIEKYIEKSASLSEYNVDKKARTSVITLLCIVVGYGLTCRYNPYKLEAHEVLKYSIWINLIMWVQVLINLKRIKDE